LQSDDLEVQISRWAKTITGANKLSVILGFKNQATIDWESRIAMFLEYLQDGCKMPHIFFDESSMSDINIPTPQVIKVTLQIKMGLDDETILDRPWSVCLWDYITIKAMDGVVSTADEEDVNNAQDLANRLFYQYNPNLKKN